MAKLTTTDQQILVALKRRAMGVAELTGFYVEEMGEHIPLSEPQARRALRRLKEAGVVDECREGHRMVYSPRRQTSLL